MLSSKSDVLAEKSSPSLRFRCEESLTLLPRCSVFWKSPGILGDGTTISILCFSGSGTGTVTPRRFRLIGFLGIAAAFSSSCVPCDGRWKEKVHRCSSTIELSRVAVCGSTHHLNRDMSDGNFVYRSNFICGRLANDSQNILGLIVFSFARLQMHIWKESCHFQD